MKLPSGTPSVPSLLTDTWQSALDLLYPPKCLVCAAYDVEAVCDRCRGEFQPFPAPVCFRCGHATDGKRPLCSACEEGAAWYFTQARAAGMFEGTLRKALQRFKYDAKRRLAVPLGDYLLDYLQTAPFDTDRFDLIVPIPLHGSRQRERGFNQSALLARHIGRSLSLPIHETVLKRVRRSRSQVGLAREARARNIQGVFSAAANASLNGKTVLLLDDILTTLSTVNEAARELVDAGAKEVYCIGVARGG